MDTIRCPNCDTWVDEDVLVCSSCGEPMGLTIFDPGSAPAPAPPGADRVELAEPATPPRLSARDRAEASGAIAAGALRGPIYARFLVSSALKEPVELEEGHIFRIGRGKQYEVCFPSNQVSRLHAEVVYENGAWVLGDLESKNGTYVNGERVLRRALAHADKIQLGHFDLTYLELTKEETFELLRRERDGSEEDTAPIAGGHTAEGLFGDLAQIDMAYVVQLISQNRKTGYVKVEGYRGGGPPIKLYVDEGEIVHATACDLEGESAAMRALRLRSGQFQFIRSGPPQRRTIHCPTGSLLLRAAAHG